MKQGKTSQREWHLWDADAAKRMQDPKYQLARNTESGSLDKKAIHAIAMMELKTSQLERRLEGDEDLTESERVKLMEALEQTNRLVWAEEYDEQTCPQLNNCLLEKLDTSALARWEARELCAQVRRIHQVKLHLGRDGKLKQEERAELNAEYDKLVAILYR